MANLRIELGGQSVMARLDGRVIRVGRDPECDLTVDDPTVAAVHVTFESLPAGGHKLTDANSGLQTRVNGLVVKRVSMKSGDIVEVGPARLTYLADEVVIGANPRPRATRLDRVPARANFDSTSLARTAGASASVRADLGSSDDMPAVTRASGERLVAAEGSRSRSRPKRSAIRLLAALGAFAVVALGIAYAVRNGGGESDLHVYRQRLDAAERLSTEDVEVALARLDELAAPGVAVEGVRREAKREAEHLRGRVEAATQEFKALESKAAELDPDRLESAYRALVDTYGKAISRRFEGVLSRAKSAYGEHGKNLARELNERALALIATDHFGGAVKLFEDFELASPWNEVTRKIVDDGRALVAERAGAAWASSAAKAAEISAERGPSAAAMWLRERLAAFAGTPLAKAVAERASTYDRQTSAAPILPTTSGVPAAAVPGVSGTGASVPGAVVPGAPTTATAPAPSSTPSQVPTAPGASLLAKLEGLLAYAETKSASRKFTEALSILDEAAKLAAGTSSASRVASARDDASSALEGMRLLATTMGTHPDRFEHFELSGSFAPSLVSADDQYIDAVISGGRTRLPWTTFDGTRLTRLVERARVAGKSSLPLAALLRETGADEASERVLARVVEDGGDRAAADALLARWRGEPVPAGGYVSHAGRLVSPVERDRLVLDARIVSACARVASKDAAARRSSYDELLSIGVPAKDAFVKALKARRAAAITEVSTHRTFTSSRVRQRLQAELEKRRVVALALIEDEKAYPYPYSEAHEGQKDVDRLVDLVREIWDRPFDLVSTWEKSIAEAMALVTEVDEVLAKALDGYTADLDAVKAAINKAIDVPGVEPDEASKKILAYNEKVSTSATPQEKDNVRAVNEYRMMMGRTAVKIDERLERAARGHSIEMRLKNYFAHESATPGLESPGKRCAREGYSSGVGENIAWGVTSGRAAFDGWYHSSGHHRNMVNKGWTEMGCGRSGPGHWTQNFGAMTGHGTKEPDALPAPRVDVAPEPEGQDGMPKDASKPDDAAMGG